MELTEVQSSDIELSGIKTKHIGDIVNKYTQLFKEEISIEEFNKYLDTTFKTKQLDFLEAINQNFQISGENVTPLIYLQEIAKQKANEEF